MKKSTKVWLGIATMWPILYMFLFFAAFILLMIVAPQDGGPPGSEPGGPVSMLLPVGIVGFVITHMLTIFGSLALTVFYIIRVFKTEQLDQNMKIMWTLLMFFFGMLAQPIFWYLYIWRETPAAASPNQSQLAPLGLRTDWRKRTTTSASEAAYVPPLQPPDWR